MSMYLRFACTAVLTVGARAMAGMGFNNLDNWPESGLTNVRIWV
jgi:hypothetical protein